MTIRGGRREKYFEFLLDEFKVQLRWDMCIYFIYVEFGRLIEYVIEFIKLFAYRAYRYRSMNNMRDDGFALCIAFGSNCKFEWKVHRVAHTNPANNEHNSQSVANAHKHCPLVGCMCSKCNRIDLARPQKGLNGVKFGIYILKCLICAEKDHTHTHDTLNVPFRHRDERDMFFWAKDQVRHPLL